MGGTKPLKSEPKLSTSEELRLHIVNGIAYLMYM